jgi:hypothetical protein
LLKRGGVEQLKKTAQAEGTLLRGNHPATLAVRRVGTRIAQKASDHYGGGFVKQMQASPPWTPHGCHMCPRTCTARDLQGRHRRTTGRETKEMLCWGSWFDSSREHLQGWLEIQVAQNQNTRNTRTRGPAGIRRVNRMTSSGFFWEPCWKRGPARVLH